MKRNIVIAALACGFLCAPLMAQTNKSLTSEISKLQQERLSALTTVLNEAQRSYELVGDFDKFLNARRNWLYAFLDANEKPQARIEALEKHLTYETKAFDTLESGTRLGTSSVTQVAEGKAKLLEFKILLLREKSKQSQ